MNQTTLKIGDRVKLHPATDAWMRGDRYGTVLRVSQRPTKEGFRWIFVDGDSGRTYRIHPDNVSEVIS